MVWLVSHLKATWPPNTNLTQPPQWCVPIAITGDVYGHTSDDTARAVVDGLAGRLGL